MTQLTRTKLISTKKLFQRGNEDFHCFPCGSDVQTVSNCTYFGFLAVGLISTRVILLRLSKIGGKKTYNEKRLQLLFQHRRLFSLVFIFSQAQATIFHKFDN